jgi:carboxylesterase type B
MCKCADLLSDARHLVLTLKRFGVNSRPAATRSIRRSSAQRVRFAAICSTMVLLLCGGVLTNATADAVLTTEGLVEGKIVGEVEQFLGIPYATAPLGELRWRAPLPPQPRSGVLQATSYPAPCIQPGGASGAIPAPNEDCLYLNIYRPVGTVAGQDKPVLLHIHGAGFQGNSASLYDGTALATVNDMIVVFTNYRLGALGWLAHPALDAETADHASSGNYGLLDVVAALHWLNQNISAFGGHPNRVMITGSSAGGIIECALITAPSATGLFQRAVIESGECTKGSAFIVTHAFATGQGQGFAAALGCGDPATTAGCLRSASAQAILSATTGFTLARANVGGVLMPLHPVDAFAQARFIVPVMIGAVHDETRSSVLPTTGFPGTMQGYQQFMSNAFGASAPLVEAQYPPAAFSDPAYAAGAATSDSGYPSGIGVCPVLVEKVAALSRITKVYAYELNDPTGGINSSAAQPPGFVVGSEHGAQLKFFYNLQSIQPQTRTPEELDMQNRMLRYYGAFAGGRPLGDGNLVWPLFNLTQQVIRFQPTGDVLVPMSTVDAEHRCAFWASLGL